MIKKNIRTILYIFYIALLGSVLFGCGDRYQTIIPPGANPLTVAAPNINRDKTVSLLNLARKKDLGDKVGVVELREEGILVHPGESRPTKVSFDLDRNYSKISVRLFIAPLPADALNNKEAGTVGVEFFLDSKSEGRIDINRNRALTKVFDFTNVDVLEIVVDNGEGKPWFDWFMFYVEDTK